MTTATAIKPATKRKPAIYKIDDEIVVARAMEILEARMYQSGPVMDNPGAVKDYLRIKMMPHTKQEVFGVLFLDSQNKVIQYREMFYGTLTQTSVYPREVARIALELGAAAVILTHNHPSGSVEPSRADIQLTSTLKTALVILDVRVLDHIIVGGTSVLSMAEKGLM